MISFGPFAGRRLVVWLLAFWLLCVSAVTGIAPVSVSPSIAGSFLPDAANRSQRGKVFPPVIRQALSAMRKPFRDLNFWGRTLRIYGSYKRQQLANRLGGDGFNATHEANSRRMLNLCLSMRGFYLKTGQFLGTRHDFMPLPYIEKLSRLHDNVPPMSAKEVRSIIERELGGKLTQFFSSIDLDKPIGSASIAQVHQGVWKATGVKVAVKVQYPSAERLCRGDLKNLRRLAEFLQRTELKFDLLSAIKELQKQIGNEFDFVGESRNMQAIGDLLRREVPEVRVPLPIFSSRRLLVMTFIEGDNLSKMAEYKSARTSDLLGLSAFSRRKAGTKLLDVLAKAWGTMIFKGRAFNADPHPGNICISREHGIGLLDWGQVKRVSDQLAGDFSRLVVAIQSRNEDSVVDSLFALGVAVSNPSDRKTVRAIALTMLDTQAVRDYVIDPFDPRNSLKTNSVTKMPSELYFIVRTVQLMRGICFAFGLDYSLAEKWAPMARATLQDLDRQNK